MVKTYCDGCGKEITRPYKPYDLEFRITRITHGYSKQYDLCRYCCEKLNNFLGGMKNENPPSE